MGCGKWENWVMPQLGAEFTWGARTAHSRHSIHSRQESRAQDQGASGKPRDATNIGWIALLLLMPLSERMESPYHNYHPTITLGNSKETCHLSCTVRRLKPKFLIPTAENSVTILSSPKWPQVEVKTSNLENAKCGNNSLPDHLNLPPELRREKA